MHNNETLKTGSCENAIFVSSGSTGGCCYDNLRCHQWWRSWHYDKSWFSCDWLILHPIQNSMIFPWTSNRNFNDFSVTFISTNFNKFQVLSMKFNDFSMILKQIWVSLIFQELWEPCTLTFATTPDKSVQDKLPILISCGFHTWCETHKKSKLATVVTTNKFIMNWTLSSRL